VGGGTEKRSRGEGRDLYAKGKERGKGLALTARRGNVALAHVERWQGVSRGKEINVSAALGGWGAATNGVTGSAPNRWGHLDFGRFPNSKRKKEDYLTE